MLAAAVTIAKLSVSSPAPPTRLSPAVSVVPVASNRSSPAVPVKAAPRSILVVRGLVAVAAKEFKINELGC
jgi:hypothetical protein